MQSKNCIQHNFHFYTANSSIRNCHFPPPQIYLKLFPLALMHETFIKLLFIAIDVFNGEIRNRFMIFPIQYFTIVGMLFYISLSLTLPHSLTLWHVKHENVFAEQKPERKMFSTSNIYKCHIVE